MTVLEALTNEPRTKRQIAERLGWVPRDVEAAIQAARLEGAPIVSSSEGYWLGTPAEVVICAARLRRRAANQYLTARALRRSAEPREMVLGL